MSAPVTANLEEYLGRHGMGGLALAAALAPIFPKAMDLDVAPGADPVITDASLGRFWDEVLIRADAESTAGLKQDIHGAAEQLAFGADLDKRPHPDEVAHGLLAALQSLKLKADIAMRFAQDCRVGKAVADGYARRSQGERLAGRGRSRR